MTAADLLAEARKRHADGAGREAAMIEIERAAVVAVLAAAASAGMSDIEVTADNLTDDQIRSLRDGQDGIDSDQLRAVCRVALQYGEPMGIHPWCRVCGWRKGGPVDSWDGKSCKCKLRAPEYHRCTCCAGMGTVPYNIGSAPCPSCDGSGLIDPTEVALARRHVADAINARAKAVR